MKKYHILQIVLNKEERDLINKEGHDAVERHAKQLNIRCSLGNEGWEEVNIEDYDHVANIAADNQEDVFSIGNSPDRNDGHPQVELIAEGFYSLSVGDIVVDADTKEVFGVAMMGFYELSTTEKNFK
tara:strand:+ start:209 stop:589 length:381 start_codon:yes stop_codon:yes gene_type:complete